MKIEKATHVAYEYPILSGLSWGVDLQPDPSGVWKEDWVGGQESRAIRSQLIDLDFTSS